MASEETSKSFLASLSKHLVLFLSITGTVLILGWIIKYSHYGIDFTDESFYLVWISNPFIYDASTTQFGFVYHPLYILLGGDIAGLRQANILITFGLAWFFTYCFLTTLAPNARDERLVLHAASAGLATSALALFDTWMTTPSYNSLAFQSLMIAGIGLLFAESNATRRSIIGWSLIAVGGWLAFMAKPSTALALAVGILLCLVFARKLSFPLLMLAVSITTILLLVTAIFIDGSVPTFTKRVLVGIEYARLIGGGHTADHIFRIDDFRLRTRGKLGVLLILLPTCAALWGMLTRHKRGPATSLFVCSGFFVLIAILCVGETDVTIRLGEFQGLLIFGVMFAAIVMGLMFGGREALRSVSLAQWSVAFLFLAMPHIYAFGTNRNYWVNGAWASIFWLLACITIVGPIACKRRSWSFALPLVLSTQVVATVLLQTGMQQPQRQTQPLKLNDATVEIGTKRAPLTLSSSYATYLSNAMSLTKTKGFKSGTPVIDLTGQSPGVLYAIGAKSIGQAWMIGDYPGSQKLAEATLSRVPCEDIAASWILLEPNGPRSISSDVLNSIGLSFPQTFRKMGTWQTPQGAGGYEEIRKQELYAPLGAQASLESCRTLRLGHPV